MWAIVLGLFLKRVIADNLNPLTLPLTDARTYPELPSSELLAMVIGYSAQIFADFAGYSLIAIGSPCCLATGSPQFQPPLRRPLDH